MTDQIQLTKAEGSELEFTRLFRVPRELIWRAYTTSEHVARWWGPRGCTAEPCTVDFRVGGVWHYCLRYGEGEESWGLAIYQEIVEHERIVYSEARSDADGNAFPPKMVISLNFSAVPEGTLLSAHGAFESTEDLQTILGMGLLEGTGSTLERLEGYSAGVAGELVSGHAVLAMAMLALSGVLAYTRWSSPTHSESERRSAGPFADWSNH